MKQGCFNGTKDLLYAKRLRPDVMTVNNEFIWSSTTLAFFTTDVEHVQRNAHTCVLVLSVMAEDGNAEEKNC